MLSQVCAKHRLLPRVPFKAGYTASYWLRRAGVEIYFGEQVVAWPEVGAASHVPRALQLTQCLQVRTQRCSG